MFRRTPPTCLCSSFRIVVLPRPTPPHKRTIDPTCRPADRLSKALFWAGHSWMPGWFDIKQVECLQAIALRGNLKGKGATLLSFPLWHPYPPPPGKPPMTRCRCCITGAASSRRPDSSGVSHSRIRVHPCSSVVGNSCAPSGGGRIWATVYPGLCSSVPLPSADSFCAVRGI